MRKMKYYLKQLLPLKYESNYEARDGLYVSTWKQWFGKVYNVKIWCIKDYQKIKQKK